MTETPLSTSMKGSVSLPRIEVTERDLAIFSSLAHARFLTAVAIEWLHFPDRRAFWEADMVARMQGDQPPAYRVGRAVYRRLHRLCEAGYLHRMIRPTSHIGRGGGRYPDVFMLTVKGGDALQEAFDIADDALTTFRVRPRSSFTTNHSAEIGAVYAALRTKIESMDGLSMQDWQGDHITARSYDQVIVARHGTEGSMERVQLPIVPDGTFTLLHPKGQVRVFVEVDRGTRRVETWRDKIYAYKTYVGSPELKARYGVDTFILLSIAPTKIQRRRLMNATAAVLGEASNRYLFCLQEAVHPLRIGGEWLKISGVSRTRMPIGLKGSPTEKVTASTVEHVFLQ